MGAIGTLVNMGGGENISIPNGFTHGMGSFNIIYRNNKAEITNKSINDYRATVTTIKYVDAVSGVDTNNGDTAGTAYKTLSKALTVACDRIILLTGGFYSSNSNYIFNVNKEIIATSSRAYVFRGVTGDTRTWINDGGGMYHCSITAADVHCLDGNSIDSDLSPLYLTSVSTSVLCSSTSNSYFNDTSTNTLYVHTINNRQPDSLILISTGEYYSSTSVSGIKIYFENISLIRGYRILNGSPDSICLIAKNCTFCHQYLSTRNLIDITHANAFVWLEDIIAKGSFKDSLNYHQNVCVVEYNVKSYNSGIGNNDSINNCSTTHETCSIIRLNGNYYNSEGPCVHDVNSAMSFNINCTAGESTSVLAGNKSSFAVAANGSETSKMWLYRCTGGTGTTFGAENRALGNSHIYARKSQISNIESGTVIESY